MFRSAAVCCGARSIGVILTGTLGDGASGLWALKQCGAITAVQHPSDAAYPEMPATALSRSAPDHLVSLAEMPALLERLVRQPAGDAVPIPEGIRHEVEIAKSGRSNMHHMDRIGRRSVLACPDCHGIMWEIDEGGLARYRCHVGHAYTAELMSLALEEGLTRALASALRALEERIAVAKKLHDQASDSGRIQSAKSWARKARELEGEADVIRTSIRRLDTLAAAES
jgi:two-component system, chemotaxis family, protein-glutamate methylesterase/glutaminase